MNTFVEDEIKQFAFSCLVCDYKCEYETILKEHEKVHHKQIGFTRYKQNNYLNVNQELSNVNQEKKLHKCALCEYSSPERRNLADHVKRMHYKEKHFWCSICPYSTYDKKSLEMHNNAIHEKRYNYKCNHCNFSTHMFLVTN